MNSRWPRILCFFALTVLLLTSACQPESTIIEDDNALQEKIPPQTDTVYDQNDNQPQQPDHPMQPTEQEPPLADLPFDQLLELPDDQYIEYFQVLNDNEIVAVKRYKDAAYSEVAIIDVNTGNVSILWNEEKYVYQQTLRIEVQDGISHIHFDIYDPESQKWYHKEFADGKEVQYSNLYYQTKSPDGKWITISTDQGIKGISTSTGREETWTSGQWDTEVVWLPDSSGFIYLNSTGKTLGDGAGPEYQLASYTIKNRKNTIYPFQKGFWGSIDWFEPGKSILASNGFDDMIGLKLINLTSRTEKQLFLEYHYGAIGYGVNRATNHLLVSKIGQFTLYHSDGKLAAQVPWPSGLDEFTHKNPAFNPDSENEKDRIYYENELEGGLMGPKHLRFSPDGQHLAYLLGAYAESVYDKVPGVKIVVSRSDTSDPVPLTDQYLRIYNIQWSLDSTKLYVHFSTPDRRSSYLGVIPINEVKK